MFIDEQSFCVRDKKEMDTKKGKKTLLSSEKLENSGIIHLKNKKQYYTEVSVKNNK